MSGRSLKRKGSATKTRASVRSRPIVSNAASSSAGWRTSITCSFIRICCAADSVARRIGTVTGLARFARAAIRSARGNISRISSSRLPLSSGAKPDTPVMLPPGRARFGTRPIATTSDSDSITIGIVVVARLAASVAGVPKLAITSTLRLTNSAACSGSRV
jgi:hypothetical protein